jgi:wyosine [tRNA(Phe)-imidazoG37] synthetase (radical SAM superfamily)
MQVERRAFYEPEEVLRDVQDKVEKAREIGETVDYLTFVPDGEPTLDVNLGREIELLRSLDIKVAVISNGSLIGHEDVREELMKADWVSLKMDSVQEQTWRRVNRPQGTLRLDSILDGALAFASEFRGELATETMLVEGLNDSDDHLRQVADFLARLRPATAYLAIPTRPPAEEWVHSPSEKAINRAYQILAERVNQVEYLIGYEGNAFAFTGDVEEDLLSITAVHLMREEAVREFLARAKADWSAVRNLVCKGRLIEMEYEGTKFYMRKLDWGCGQMRETPRR